MRKNQDFKDGATGDVHQYTCILASARHDRSLYYGTRTMVFESGFQVLWPMAMMRRVAVAGARVARPAVP
eukprot:3452192-Prymnesium_polylepis.1